MPGTGSILRVKTCPSCGCQFECRTGKCWCDNVTVDADSRAALRERYVDCLCPACLNTAGAVESATRQADA